MSFSGLPWPHLPPSFFAYAVAGGIFQILASVCLISLLQLRNFAVGVTLIKVQVIFTALLGFVILGDSVTAMAMGAIVTGVMGVLLLSDPPKAEGHFLMRILNRGTALGLMSAIFFAWCAVMIRAATLHVVADQIFTRASFTLMVTIISQFVLMSLWLRLRQPGQITATLRAWRVAKWVGILSLAGSMGWFTAFAMANAAYVQAVSQVEIIFTTCISIFILGESITRKEVLGCILIISSVVFLVLSL